MRGTNPARPSRPTPRARLAVERLEDRRAASDLAGGPDGGWWLWRTLDAPDQRPAAVTATHRLADDQVPAAPVLPPAECGVPSPAGQQERHHGASSNVVAAQPGAARSPGDAAWFDHVHDASTPFQAASRTEGAGQLYVTTVGDNAIKQVNPAGHVRDFATSGLNGPILIDFDHSGNVYVANFYGGSISKVAPNGAVSTFASVNAPIGVQFDAHGVLYVSSPNINTISKVSPDGTVTPFVSAGLIEPLAMVFDRAGNTYVTNFGVGPPDKPTPGACFVTRVTLDGTVGTIAAGFTGPTGLAFDAAGTLYVASDKSRIDKIAPDGTLTPFVTAGLNVLADMTFGRDGVLYVANEGGGTVSKVTPDGAVSTFLTGLLVPQDVAFRPGPER
jgi:sugar lactone lactonase YvrE